MRNAFFLLAIAVLVLASVFLYDSPATAALTRLVPRDNRLMLWVGGAVLGLGLMKVVMELLKPGNRTGRADG